MTRTLEQRADKAEAIYKRQRANHYQSKTAWKKLFELRTRALRRGVHVSRKHERALRA